MYQCVDCLKRWRKNIKNVVSICISGDVLATYNNIYKYITTILGDYSREFIYIFANIIALAAMKFLLTLTDVEKLGLNGIYSSSITGYSLSSEEVWDTEV